MAARNTEGSVYAETVTPRPGAKPRTRWVAQVKVRGVKRRTTHTSEAKARRALRAMLNEAESGRLDHRNMTVRQLLTDWQAKALPNRRLEPATIDRHRHSCKALIADLGSRKVAKLTPDDIEDAFAARASNGTSKATLAKMRTTLGMALAWAERRGYVARNAARSAELPPEARPAKPGRSMTADEARAFLKAAERSPLGAMWITMLYLGLRPGEAAGLSWGDVDLDAGTIHVHQGRKRGERGELLIGEPKTPQSKRWLDAPPPVVAALREHRKRQNRARLAAGPLWSNRHDLVFASSVGTPLEPANARRDFKAVIVAAGLDDGWTPNALRHTAASLMSDAGLPLEDVADQLGHRDTRMASLHYRHRVRPTVSGGTVLADVLGQA